jgi:hypothetical protein
VLILWHGRRSELGGCANGFFSKCPVRISPRIVTRILPAIPLSQSKLRISHGDATPRFRVPSPVLLDTCILPSQTSSLHPFVICRHAGDTRTMRQGTTSVSGHSG